MKAAIYARKSTDQENASEEAKSVTRQIENATKYATKRGWDVDQRFIYSDDGVSGADFKDRAGLLRLLSDIHGKRPPFEVLVVADESRLGRERSRPRTLPSRSSTRACGSSST